MESISFGRDKTQIIKGIALILMLFHHTGVPGFWAVDGTNLYSALAQIQNATKMCVDIFTFFIGYGFFCSNNKSLSYSFKRILLLLIPYWFMFLFMFLPCCYLSGNLPEVLVNNKHGVHWIIELIYNLFGFSSTINQYSWFVAFYICAILLLPFVHKVINKCPPHLAYLDTHLLCHTGCLTLFTRLGTQANNLHPVLYGQSYAIGYNWLYDS